MPEFYERMKDRLRTPLQGADTALWLAMSPAPLKNTSGLFYQGEYRWVVFSTGYVFEQWLISAKTRWLKKTTQGPVGGYS